MRLTNTTKISNDVIREVVRFVRPSGISNFDIMVRNLGGRGVAGRFYPRGSIYHSTRNSFIVARIGKKFPYVQKIKPRGGYLPQPPLGTVEEGLVFILAHELRHQWQAKHPKGYRVWGSWGQYSERDADAYAIHKLREWRRKL